MFLLHMCPNGNLNNQNWILAISVICAFTMKLKDIKCFKQLLCICLVVQTREEDQDTCFMLIRNFRLTLILKRGGGVTLTGWFSNPQTCLLDMYDDFPVSLKKLHIIFIGKKYCSNIYHFQRWYCLFKI